MRERFQPTGCGLYEVWRNLETTVDRMLFQTTYADVCRFSRHPRFSAEQLAQGLGAGH